MNINQLLNPASTPSSSQLQTSVRRLDHQLQYDRDTSSTGKSPSRIHHSNANYVGQDTRISGSEVLAAKHNVRNTELTSSVNESTTQSYGVQPAYMTHGRLPFLTTPPYPSSPSRVQYTPPVAPSRFDISSQLPIGNISLHGTGSGFPALTMGQSRKGEFSAFLSIPQRREPRYTDRPL